MNTGDEFIFPGNIDEFYDNEWTNDELTEMVETFTRDQFCETLIIYSADRKPAYRWEASIQGPLGYVTATDESYEAALGWAVVGAYFPVDYGEPYL